MNDMGDKSKIEWTDASWNPVTGCSHAGTPACDNCYARKTAAWLEGLGQENYRNGFKPTCHPHMLDVPIRWKRPRKIFTVSMGDLFHRDVPFEFIAAVFGVMAACPQHTFQVLTKRPTRMREWFHYLRGYDSAHMSDCVLRYIDGDGQDFAPTAWPIPNVWLGVTTEDQRRADERIPQLLQCPAAVHFISVEPMLSAVNADATSIDGGALNALSGERWQTWTASEQPQPSVEGKGIDWVVCGGESGPNARPMHPDWVRSLRDQCVREGVSFMFKQWGEWVPESQAPSSLSERTAETALYVDEDGSTRPANQGARGKAVTVQRVGKKKSGRLLDGELWDQYPLTSAQKNVPSQGTIPLF